MQRSFDACRHDLERSFGSAWMMVLLLVVALIVCGWLDRQPDSPSNSSHMRCSDATRNQEQRGWGSEMHDLPAQ
jgi:hypothetical protein